MEASPNDAHVHFIPHNDDNTTHQKARGATLPCFPNRDSIISRSRLNSRLNFRHYTQSVYSELNRAQSYGSDEAKSDNILIPALEAVEDIKITKQIKRINQNEIHVLFTLSDSYNSREPFELLTWKQGADNAFYFSSEAEKATGNKSEANFIYAVKEYAQDFTSAEIYYENKGVNEKLGSVKKYREQSAEDIIVSDKNGSVLYKLVEDVKPMSRNISCLMLDLQGNKMSSAEIDFQQDDEVTNCKATFPPESNARQKLMLLTALVFKMAQLEVVEKWRPIERRPQKERSSSFASFFFCFFNNNK